MDKKFHKRKLNKKDRKRSKKIVLEEVKVAEEDKACGGHIFYWPFSGLW